MGGYVAGIAATGGFLFVSGQTPEGPDGTSSGDPEEQFRQIWRNVSAVLAGAGVGVDALVRVRTFLASRDHRELNSRVRREVLALHEPALTVVICQLYDEGWITEIEAVAQLPAAERQRTELARASAASVLAGCAARPEIAKAGGVGRRHRPPLTKRRDQSCDVTKRAARANR